MHHNLLNIHMPIKTRDILSGEDELNSFSCLFSEIYDQFAAYKTMTFSFD